MFSAQKVLGWFRNQRTAVGKLYKKKSGQAATSMTKRQQWQEKAFSFLREAIEPRTYSRDTASVSLKKKTKKPFPAFHAILKILLCFLF